MVQRRNHRQPGSPRSRILHPIWEGNTGWIGTHRNSYKAKHLAHNPHMSLAYIMDAFKPVYVECVAEWDDSLEQKRRVWDLFKYGPAPVGYDPTDTFISPEHENFGMSEVDSLAHRHRDVSVTVDG